MATFLKADNEKQLKANEVLKIIELLLYFQANRSYPEK